MGDGTRGAPKKGRKEAKKQRGRREPHEKRAKRERGEEKERVAREHEELDDRRRREREERGSVTEQDQCTPWTLRIPLASSTALSIADPLSASAPPFRELAALAEAATNVADGTRGCGPRDEPLQQGNEEGEEGRCRLHCAAVLPGTQTARNLTNTVAGDRYAGRCTVLARLGPMLLSLDRSAG